MKAKLELEYKKNPKPDKKEKHRMALDFDMTDDNVHFWYVRINEEREGGFRN